MSDKPAYMVIKDDMKGVAGLVRSAMREGYVPQGGICHAGGDLFLQAMILPSPSPAPAPPISGELPIILPNGDAVLPTWIKGVHVPAVESMQYYKVILSLLDGTIWSFNYDSFKQANAARDSIVDQWQIALGCENLNTRKED